MTRKVKFVRFQTSVHFPDAGELGFVLPPPVKVLQDLKMTSYGADGVTVAFSFLGKKNEVWVPSSNIVLALLEPEEKYEKTSR